MKCKSILVADDNRDVRETIVDALKDEGYHALGAKDGKDALAKLADMPVPTLILLDLMMPVMSGWEFLDAQKSNAKFASHQVITISSVNPTKTLETTEPLDIAGSLQKPLSFGSLWDKVQEFCETPMPASSGGQKDLNP